jgi:hypothetical protein
MVFHIFDYYAEGRAIQMDVMEYSNAFTSVSKYSLGADTLSDKGYYVHSWTSTSCNVIYIDMDKLSIDQVLTQFGPKVSEVIESYYLGMVLDKLN